jgi:hypothetical protein
VYVLQAAGWGGVDIREILFSFFLLVWVLFVVVVVLWY